MNSSLLDGVYIRKPKYPRYQDYVIADGKLVGEFEQMYQDYDDPWHQSRDIYAADKTIALHLMRKVGARRVLDLGCGLGHFTHKIAESGFTVLGVDISQTAISKARVTYPDCHFTAGDVLDFGIYHRFQPDLIIMAEITWYVLDELDALLRFMRSELREVYIIHLLVTYPAGEQNYGTDKFSTLPEIMKYFDMNYLEWGQIRSCDRATAKTFFLGRW